MNSTLFGNFLYLDYSLYMLLVTLSKKVNHLNEDWFDTNGLHCTCNICFKHFNLNPKSIKDHGMKHLKEKKLVAFI